jgi:hypothetical protein
MKPTVKPFPTKLTPEALAAIVGAMIVTILVVYVIMSVIIGIFIFLLARKLQVKLPILGFIPILQNWTLAACAGTSTLMTILLFLLQFIFFPLAGAIIFFKVAGRLGKSEVLGLILGLIIPIVPLIWFAFASAEGAASMGAAGGMGELDDLSGEPDIPDLDFDLEEESPAPKPKPAAKPKEEPSQYEDDWQMPEEGGGQQQGMAEEQSADDWQLPDETDEGEQSVDDWQLPQDDEE